MAKDSLCGLGGRRLLLLITTTALSAVACATTGGRTPPRLPDGDDLPALYAAAVEQRCAPCAHGTVYLVDEYLTVDGGGDPLPGEARERLVESFGEVRLTSLFGVAALEGVLTPPRGRARVRRSR